MIKKVLLIDDDEDEFFLLKDVLSNLDTSISLSLIQTPDQVAKDLNFDVPDVLFLDINMPIRDGFEWLQLIRVHYPNLPVIMYSTGNSTSVIRKAYEAGATLYLTKPHNLHRFQQDLKFLFGLDWSKPEAMREELWKDGKPLLLSNE